MPYRLHDPLWLLLLLALPLAAWWRGRRGAPVLLVPFAAAWQRGSVGAGSRWPQILAVAGLAALIVALARPQHIEETRQVRQQGYDLILAIDLSASMLTEDFEREGRAINRLQAIQPIIEAFIRGRPTDRIGLVVFAGRAYTLAPLTFDHAWLGRQIERLKVGLLEDGTAIGDGLGVALTRLEQAERAEEGRRQGAFVILMTDGSNNRGALTPEQATALAAARGIPVYTIGAGRPGLVPFPRFDEQGRRIGVVPVASDLDESTLASMAEKTGGKFFRAYDLKTTEKAFAAIDRARKIEFDARSQVLARELFAWPAGLGLGALLLGAILARRGASDAKETMLSPEAAA